MASDARIRASDADRDRAATALREHLAAGRLTIEEFEERLNQTFAAKTLGDIDRVLADLPGTGLDRPEDAAPGEPAAGPPLPEHPVYGTAERSGDRYDPAWRPVWRPWLTITAIFFLIWLFSGAAGGPWFLWISLVAGVVLLARRSRGGRGPRRSP